MTKFYATRGIGDSDEHVFINTNYDASTILVKRMYSEPENWSPDGHQGTLTACYEGFEKALGELKPGEYVVLEVKVL